MKVLDVSSLHDVIKGMSRQLSELEKQLNHVENGIRTFVSSKDSFRGKGASAIRRFYEYAHLPFLQFFQMFLANFQSKLHQLQLELDGLECYSRGFIDEGFLSSDLEDGLNQLNRMVTELTGETNAQLSRISDIVYLPRLQDHQFNDSIQQAKQSANQTVDKLHQFDHRQTQSFTALIEDLALINSYIEEMSQQFASGKIKMASFSPVMLQDLKAYGKLQTKLYNQTVMQRWNSEHFPELGVFFPIGHATSFDQWVNPSCARPEPKKKTAGEALWDFTTGFGAGIISAATDTWDGIKRLATEPDQVLKETIEFLDAVVSDPAILLEIGHELYNSFNESVIHCDATSRGEWLGYATAIIGTSVVGDKGLSKVGGIAGKLGTKVETDLNIKLKDQQEKVISSVKGSSAAGLERVRELMGGMFPNNKMAPSLAGGPVNVIDSFGLNNILKEKQKDIIAKVEVNSVKNSSEAHEPTTNITAEDIPTAKSGDFNPFFNSLTTSELDTLWKDKKVRKKIERQLRAPGGLHEWHLVSRAPQFKYWNISAEEIKELRTVISDVKFVNPDGVHGGLGSTRAHNELLAIIDTSIDYNTFIRRLNNWADYRLEGGISSLPSGLRLN
ncbi:MAG: LXG domain-containing protein [Bacillota bacterium]|nr:LXG domain-containing protein [Bacillota bacterium]